MLGGPAQTTMLASCVGQPLPSTAAGVFDCVIHWREAFITSVNARSLTQSSGVSTFMPILFAGGAARARGTAKTHMHKKPEDSRNKRFTFGVLVLNRNDMLAWSSPLALTIVLIPKRSPRALFWRAVRRYGNR